MNSDLQFRIEKKFAEPIKSTVAVSGGCIANSCKLQLSSGKEFFLKQSRGGSSSSFESEARGLEELRKSGVVRVPEVVDKGPDFLLLLEKLFLVVIVEPTMKSLKKMVLQLKSKKPKQ